MPVYYPAAIAANSPQAAAAERKQARTSSEKRGAIRNAKLFVILLKRRPACSVLFDAIAKLLG
jgi:hypothetical protein